MPKTGWMYALAGAVSAGVALGISEFIAGLNLSAPSLVAAIGEEVINLTPPAVESWAINTFGTNDKAVLVAGIVVISVLIGAGLGIVARRLTWVVPVVFAGFGVLGYMAGIGTSLASTTYTALAAVGAALVGMGTLLGLRWVIQTRIEAVDPPTIPGGTSFASEEQPDERATEPAPAPAIRTGRRAFLAGSAGAVVVAAGAALLGRNMGERTRIQMATQEGTVLPQPVEAVPPATAAQMANVAGVSPLVTPNEDFYRIDTALGIPAVDIETWTLSFTGLVDNPFSLSYQQILDRPMVERYVTLACVSNAVGGELIGNAKWLGIPLRTLVEEAQVQEAATQLIGRSVDGFTVGFPTAAVFDGREALLAVGMNDEALPFEHGYPARLVVSGLYGYVSATKWLSEIEFARWEDFDAYWIPRGWAKQAPIKTQSRIDTPRLGASFPSGPTTIGGVAWAQGRGISMVEVSVDEGPWVQATLPEELTVDSWRQWYLTQDFAPGRHQIAVRATDGNGDTQIAERLPPRPDGATGYHTIVVNTTEA